MNVFANRSIWKKIVIVFSLMFSMTVVEPTTVKASIGGELMEPICDIVVGFGDGIMGLFQNVLIGQETTYIRVHKGNKIIRALLTGFAILVVLVVAGLVISGVVLPIAGVVAAKLGLIATVVKAGAIMKSIVPVLALATFFGVRAYGNMGDDVVLPLYSLSPEYIFSDTYPIFDVNFFRPNSKILKYQWIHKLDQSDIIEDRRSAGGKYEKVSIEEERNLDFSNATDVTDQYLKEFKSFTGLDTSLEERVSRIEQIEVDGKKYIKLHIIRNVGSGDAIEVQNIEEIRRVPDTSEGTAEGEEQSPSASGERKALDKIAYTKELQNTVKFWYNIIRTIAIVGMMSVLVYIGIRILLSSTSDSKKAKYKETLKDWLVGMVLLFTMQYIMIFANIAVEHLTEVFKNINPMGYIAYIKDNDGKIREELQKYNMKVTDKMGGDSSAGSSADSSADSGADSGTGSGTASSTIFYFTDAAEDTYIEWHTDLMGQLRIGLQNARDDGEEYIGYTIMFFVMVIYTFIFCFTYIKRVIYMAFLTVVSPLVALTYPIDKVNDGSAQGFNYWFKEYIFNLLLQPIHLLIYTILVSSAIEFATKNMIYSLVALGFITQAEKIVRQMFNFSKVSTPGVFAGPAGAAVVMSGMRWLMGHGPNGGAGGKLPVASGGTNNPSAGKMLKSKNDGVDSNVVINSLANEITSEGGDVVTNTATSVVDNIVDDNNTQSNPIRMREAELEEGPNAPDMETLQEMENERRYALNNNNDNNNRTQLTNEEYEQQLRDEGMSEEDIALIMGSLEPSTTSTESSKTAENSSSDSTSEKTTESMPEGAKTTNNVRTTNTNQTDNDFSQDNSDQQTAQNEPKKGLINALSTTASAYGEGMSYKLAEGIYNARIGRRIGRGIGGAFLAATAGTIGVAAGVASGDMKNVITHGAALAAGGYKVGANTLDSISNAVNVDGLEETAARAYLGDDEYAKQNRMRRATQQDWIDKIMEKKRLSKQEAKNEARDKYSEYLKYGHSDIGDIIKMEEYRTSATAQRLTGKKEGYTVAEVSKLHDLGQKHRIGKMQGDKDKDDIVKQHQKDYNINKEQAIKLVQQERSLFNAMND